MAYFARTTPAPQVKGGYRSFRQFVREDFNSQCAYCLLSEVLAGGEENFELDHFRPKSLFAHLLKDFYNIYYSCHPCNHMKRAAWPPPELEARGISIVDLCKDNFDTHFVEDPDGKWASRTDSGNYTIDILRLNRKHLIVIRKLLAGAGLTVHQGITERELRRALEI
jgi:hypothetical protein